MVVPVVAFSAAEQQVDERLEVPVREVVIQRRVVLLLDGAHRDGTQPQAVQHDVHQRAARPTVPVLERVNPHDFRVDPYGKVERRLLVARVVRVLLARAKALTRSSEDPLELSRDVTPMNRLVRTEHQVFLPEAGAARASRVGTDSIEESAVDLADELDPEGLL